MSPVIGNLLDMRGRRSPLGFLLCVCLGGLYVCFAPQLVTQLLAFNHHLQALSVYIALLILIDGGIFLFTQAVRRLNSMGREKYLSVLIFIPLLNAPLFLYPNTIELSAFAAGSLRGVSILILLWFILMPRSSSRTA